ncbi:MAG: rhamnosyltransferase [Candidatus Accumulibacter appositus]|uniref:Rhamnosyltransferase n=1 Tax=Candidatus Accumulibacter appositus TaxID=1454003 RepID=A0A011PP67_9PROT|nr:glycosyltransferase [Accumulibacter sp.]EXI78680.1 MAG: rhamnosyltransferase [Candidatus Accumulibacter appositus]HRF03339.1 NTP transferase domain-containing protein [Accumulibacter sp.]
MARTNGKPTEDRQDWPRVCAIIVTYGARHQFLARVLARVVACGIAQVVVVFNGNYAANVLLPENCTIVNSPRNLGSAGGFKAGIEAALELDAEYFLLLDDDNLLASDCLQRLLSAWQKLGGTSLTALQAYRPSQPWHRIAVREGVLAVGRPNTYGWFNVSNEPHLLRRQLAAGDSSFALDVEPQNALVSISLAAYGGLFLGREALQLPERPDPRYFCYYDDFDFTDRLVRRGVEIHLCADARIEDIDSSWHALNERVHPTFSPHTADERIYLDLRNAFIFYRSRITSRAFYGLNAVGFWLGMAYLALFRSADIGTTKRRLALICRAVRFGSRGEFAPYDDGQESRPKGQG